MEYTQSLQVGNVHTSHHTAYIVTPSNKAINASSILDIVTPSNLDVLDNIKFPGVYMLDTACERS
jgi:hypothetical protein